MGDLQTDFLIGTPTFLSGMASAFDIAGSDIPINRSNSPEEADARALYSDWAMVGQDIEMAMKHEENREYARK